jgi:antitoxin (DNA-binding transcriptional repressor) of toxin-antitoxin stability system
MRELELVEALACLGLMDRVAATGEEIAITKRGAPVAKLVAGLRRPDPQCPDSRTVRTLRPAPSRSRERE